MMYRHTSFQLFITVIVVIALRTERLPNKETVDRPFYTLQQTGYGSLVARSDTEKTGQAKGFYGL
jgi:hypothetical protein